MLVFARLKAEARYVAMASAASRHFRCGAGLAACSSGIPLFATLPPQTPPLRAPHGSRVCLASWLRSQWQSQLINRCVRSCQPFRCPKQLKSVRHLTSPLSSCRNQTASPEATKCVIISFLRYATSLSNPLYPPGCLA